MLLSLRIFFAVLLAIAVITPNVSEARAKSKASHRLVAKKKHAKKARRSKLKSKRPVRGKHSARKRKGKKRRAHRKSKSGPEAWTARPVTATKVRRVPRNSYSDSPDEANLTAAPAAAIPLHDPNEKPEERRVRLDMTRPYGAKKPEAVPGPDRGIAGEPAAPSSSGNDLFPGEYGPPAPPPARGR